MKLGKNIPDFYEIVTAPIMKVCVFDKLLRDSETHRWRSKPFLLSRLLGQILNRWFESEPLRATLATDAVIGAMTSPSNPGSG